MKRKFIGLFTLILAALIVLTMTGCNLTVVNGNDSDSTTKTQDNTESVTTKELNAYELAVVNGFSGTYDEWLLSLVDTSSYESIYDLAVSEGIFTGTLQEFIESLKGDAGVSSIETAAASSVNSVVSVYCNFSITQYYRTWGGQVMSQTSEAESGGSGVIIKDDKESGVAYIVTNYHVVYYSGADSEISDDITVYLYGMEYSKFAIPATYIGGSMTYDIAVLKIESDIYKNSGAAPAIIGVSDEIAVGEDVIAVGNAKAEGISVTKGVVSVKHEQITMTAADEKTTVAFTVIRIDAAVNSGNSGGGLFDADGTLIGIVNAKTVNTSVEGMCYAIPIDLAYGIAEKIMATCDGTTTTTITKVTSGITLDVYSSKSVYDSVTKTNTVIQEIEVSEVSSGAAKGVLKAGDIISAVTYNGTTYAINDMFDLENVLVRITKGETADFIIYRNSEMMTVTLTFSTEESVE